MIAIFCNTFFLRCAYYIYGDKPDLMSPQIDSSQSIATHQRATFSISMKNVNGFEVGKIQQVIINKRNRNGMRIQQL